MTTQSYLSSPLKEETVNTIRQNLEQVRNAPGAKESRALFIHCVSIMTEETLAYFFLNPMDIIEAGSITRKFVNMGVSGSMKMINSMGKKATGSLSDEQMLELVAFMDSLIIEK